MGDNDNRNNPVEFSDGKENGNFSGKKTNILEWKEIRFLLIAFYKEDPKTCLFARLPKELLKKFQIFKINLFYLFFLLLFRYSINFFKFKNKIGAKKTIKITIITTIKTALQL